MLTPEQARARLQDARADLRFPAVLYNRPGIDPMANVISALEKVISLLEDALA